jgi:predicted ATPase
MLTRLYLENYRAFKKLDLPLTKINLFLGPNNAGKSSILSAINLLSQTMSSDDPEIPLSLTGKFEELGSYKDIVHNNVPSLPDISIGLEFSSERIKRLLHTNVFGITVTYHYRKQRHETVVKSLEVYTPPQKQIIHTQIAQKGSNQLIQYVDPQFKNVKLNAKSSGSIFLEHFFPLYISPTAGMHPLEDILFSLRRVLAQHLNSVEFISPFRKGPDRFYTYSGETPSTVGVHGENAIKVIVADHFRRMSKKLNIAENISKWLQQSQIASSLKVVPLTDRHFEIRLSHYDTKEDENLADVGYGCSQILPILCAGYSIEKDSILIIEQPEIHLHPRAQAEIGSFLYEISQRNVQLFIETHSEHLLLRLQSHVASGDLPPDDVSVYYVYSDPHSKLYKRIPLGPDGFYTEDWPKGFFPERLEETKRVARFNV